MSPKSYFVVAAGLVASALCAAQSTAHDAVLDQFRSPAEQTAKDAVWTSPSIFKVGVLDNHSNRDGYARYVCGEISAKGLAGRGVTVQIIDVAKLKQSGKWVKLGETRCK